jgi:hypothetical protein
MTRPLYSPNVARLRYIISGLLGALVTVTVVYAFLLIALVPG